MVAFRSRTAKCFLLFYTLIAIVINCTTRNATAQDVFDKLQENVWYLTTTDKAARLYVTSLGEGPPVIVLHGGPGNDFNYLVDAIRPQTAQHKFILFDQRGSLLSPVKSDDLKTITAANMVEDIDLLRKTLGVDKVTIMAHSWGTLLAELYFEAHPDHVSGLILTGSFAPRTPPGETFTDSVKRIHARQKALHERPEVAAVIKQAGVDGPIDTLTPVQRWARLRIENFAASSLYHVDHWPQYQGGGVYYNKDIDSAVADSLPDTLDIAPTLDAHPVPIAVIQGDADYVDPAGSSWNYLTPKDDVRVSVIPQASHYEWIDNPKDFNAALHDALQHLTKPN